MDEKLDGCGLIIICREVDKETGRVAVYTLNMDVTERLLHNLGIRARVNPELSYYVTTKAHYAGFKDAITAVLKRKQVTPEDIKRVGRITKI